MFAFISRLCAKIPVEAIEKKIVEVVEQKVAELVPVVEKKVEELLEMRVTPEPEPEKKVPQVESDVVV